MDKATVQRQAKRISACEDDSPTPGPYVHNVPPSLPPPRAERQRLYCALGRDRRLAWSMHSAHGVRRAPVRMLRGGM
jgi:hypothetical protein